jgi:hypothetical protein
LITNLPVCYHCFKFLFFNGHALSRVILPESKTEEILDGSKLVSEIQLSIGGRVIQTTRACKGCNKMITFDWWYLRDYCFDCHFS